MSQLDEELKQYQELIGDKAYHREYSRLYEFAKSNKARYSGKDYVNSKEKLQAIKEKYKNGVTMEHINQMVNNYG